jgi:hypothetical protein
MQDAHMVIRFAVKYVSRATQKISVLALYRKNGLVLIKFVHAEINLVKMVVNGSATFKLLVIFCLEECLKMLPQICRKNCKILCGRPDP